MAHYLDCQVSVSMVVFIFVGWVMLPTNSLKGLCGDVLRAGYWSSVHHCFRHLLEPENLNLAKREEAYMKHERMFFHKSDVFSFRSDQSLVALIFFLLSYPFSWSLSVCVCSFRWTRVSALVYYCSSYRYTASQHAYTHKHMLPMNVCVHE